MTFEKSMRMRCKAGRKEDWNDEIDTERKNIAVKMKKIRGGNRRNSEIYGADEGGACCSIGLC